MANRTLISKVAGTTFDGRQEVIAALRGDEPLRIEPQPDNPYDKNALAVIAALHNGKRAHLGFIPRDLAAQIAPHLEVENAMARLLEITGGFETSDGEIAAYGLRIAIEIPDNTTVVR